MTTQEETHGAESGTEYPDHWLVRVACATDVGRVRRSNEDNYLVALEHNMFIVSDGMGGQLAGEVASKIVVTVLPHVIAQRLAGLHIPSIQMVERALRDAIVELSQKLRAETAVRPDLKGMGATVALVWLRGTLAHLAHMGDSRIYLLRRGRLTKMTEDHSVVALLLKHGELTPEETRVHPARGRLSRFVGMEGEVYPDVQTLSLRGGDRLLLCSDGLTGMVTDDEIAQLLAANPDPADACHALVTTANAAGGEDNVTAVVVDCQRSSLHK